MPVPFQAQESSDGSLRTVVKRRSSASPKPIELLPLQTVSLAELQLEELLGRGETGGVYRASSGALNDQRAAEEALPPWVAVRRLEEIVTVHYASARDLQ